jgi:hypothetical protein
MLLVNIVLKFFGHSFMVKAKQKLVDDHWLILCCEIRLIADRLQNDDRVIVGLQLLQIRTSFHCGVVNPLPKLRFDAICH